MFCEAVNRKGDGHHYRLPTEAEWEYASRGGDSSCRYGSLDVVAWFRDNSGGTTHPVGEKKPNRFGLYDTLGNVWEWVQDWYGITYYGRSPESDPKGPLSGEYRVSRGGSFRGLVRGQARVSSRYIQKPNVRSIVDWVPLCARTSPLMFCRGSFLARLARSRSRRWNKGR